VLPDEVRSWERSESVTRGAETPAIADGPGLDLFFLLFFSYLTPEFFEICQLPLCVGSVLHGGDSNL